jgi:hypothetical protein
VVRSREQGGSGLTGAELPRRARQRIPDCHGGGLRQWQNALVLVAPDRELRAKTGAAMREVMAYEGVLDDAEADKHELSQRELRDLSASLSAAPARAFRGQSGTAASGCRSPTRGSPAPAASSPTCSKCSRSKTLPPACR